MPMHKTALDIQVQSAIYTHIYQTGEAPTRAQLQGIINISPGDIQITYEHLVDARVLVLDPQTSEIVMAIPFSATPTAYPVKTETNRYWANCMWDALGIMAALDEDSTLTTTCPDCDEPLRLTTENGQLVGDNAVMHILIPVNEWWDNITFT